MSWLLGLASLGSLVVLSIAFVGLLVTGGPGAWLGAVVVFWWVGRKVWRFLDQPVPVDVSTVLPSDHR